MPAKLFTVLVLGDIIGHPGMRAVTTSLATLRSKYRPNLILANAENACEGFGITYSIIQELHHVGVDVITTGNHVWRQDEAYELLNREDRVLRPINYPSVCPGKGWCSMQVNEKNILIINAQGRKHMDAIDCPFKAVQAAIKKQGDNSSIVIVDFHAEDVAEKQTFAQYFDGKASLVFGTHTHTQTRDARIQQKGTGYCTDIGACIPRESVIGFNANTSVKNMTTNIPLPFTVSENTATIHGVVAAIDSESGSCVSIETLVYESIL